MLYAVIISPYVIRDPPIAMAFFHHPHDIW
jgi:hypothetical protein